jgi:hypothetical protein
MTDPNIILIAACFLLNGVALKLTQAHYKRRYDRRSKFLYMSLNSRGELETRLNNTKALLKGIQ